MAEFVDRQRKNRERNRPAVNFTERDDVRDFARSAHGQNYNRMMDITRQLPTMSTGDPRVQEYKDRRRTFNRYGKNPMGEIFGRSPQQMQDHYMNLSRGVRDLNKPVYNKMYPLTGGLMDVGEKGGILGTILSEIGKMGKDRGIVTNVDDSVAEQERYVTETFGPHRENIEELDITDEYEGPWPHEDMPTFPDIYRGPRPHQGLPTLDVYEGRRPHEDMPLLPREAGQPPEGAVDVTGDPTRKRDVGYDITASDLDVAPMPPADYGDLEYFDWVDKYYDTHNPDGTPKSDPTVIPGGGTSYVDRFAPIEEEIVEEVIPPVLFNDSLREAGIASLHGQGPRWGSTNRRYEKAYRDYVMSGGEQMDYDDFEIMYEKIYQGKPHALHSSYR